MKGQFQAQKLESLKTYNCSKGGNPYCLNGPIDVLEEPTQSTSLCFQRKPVDIFILIFSAMGDQHRRNTIRRTWSLADNPSSEAIIQYMFVLGMSESRHEMDQVENESFQHGDIIQGDFKDTYRNLTLKTILGFTWFRLSCPHARFFLKTDDDTLVNIFSAVRFAWVSMNVGHVMSGYCMQEREKKFKDPNDRWYISSEQYPDETLPPYCCGCGYILTAHTARDIADVMPWLPILPIEDLFTGVAISRLPYDVEIRHKPLLFQNYPRSGDKYEMYCDLISHGGVILLHEFPEDDAEKFFNECAWRP